MTDLTTIITAGATPLPPIGLDPSPSDFRMRAVRVELLLSAVKEHLLTLVADARVNDAGSTIADAELEASITAHLTDLCADISGAFEAVAECITDAHYDGCPRGPMFRRRS